ncbi:DUF4226 domain-containing protein [Mycobacterium spongiae]|nr:DUF4226 domain-containing protein [Mycobacterium spongiae]
MAESGQHPKRGEVPSDATATPAESSRTGSAEAIADAELALAHQNSASAQLDLLVISAILNAHLKAVEGREALNQLQQDTEAAVRTRSDLDTPAGARDFQRFLIGKLRDIRGVVANASLDDTSKSALMAAWTSLYNASQVGSGTPRDPEAATTTVDPGPAGSAAGLAASPDAAWDPALDALLLDDPALVPEDLVPQPPAAPVMPTLPSMPAIPSLGGEARPGVATSPSSAPGWTGPGDLPFSGLLRGGGLEPIGLDDGAFESSDPDPRDYEPADEPEEHAGDEHEDASSEQPGSPLPGGPTTVALPNGETVTAASPELAAAIKAAAGGAPIAAAFQQQGIAIPAPGTAVTDPIDPAHVIPGDIGIFTDRHALALGRSEALLDGQIQHISTVTGPSFLGWEHPPTPPPATAPANTAAPTPTRPAGSSTTSPL